MAERTDLFRILADLQYAGVSNAAVAQLIEVSRYKIIRWKLGASGDYDEVNRLMALHARVCPEKRDVRKRKRIRFSIRA